MKLNSFRGRKWTWQTVSASVEVVKWFYKTQRKENAKFGTNSAQNAFLLKYWHINHSLVRSFLNHCKNWIVRNLTYNRLWWLSTKRPFTRKNSLLVLLITILAYKCGRVRIFSCKSYFASSVCFWCYFVLLFLLLIVFGHLSWRIYIKTGPGLWWYLQLKKDKVVPLHAMEALWMRGSIAPILS
jgi:hypothetical protein